ncbi:hypothetical protein FNV43_RR22250 [Rhamnella rubrinervis]|uniref:Patatin n=1 Tax=Rhamnella rubrinervis TaxID=2594499 RepID=A0A8K0GSC1_9ROSA|nr:hypothetical protein FNV43_RR22250 [Rhamnella rubrinervis]
MALSSPAFFSTTHSSSSSTSVKLLHSHHHPFTHFHFPTTTPTIHTLFGTTTSPASEKWRANVSFFPAFLNIGKKDAKTLKDELLDAIEPLDRGADATPEDQQRVDQIASKLEAVNPIKEPLKSDLLNGKWELIYTTSISILQTQRPKFLRSRTNYQAINLDTLRAQNTESWPFFNQVTADLTPLNARKVAVKFDYFKIAGLIPVKAPGRARGELEITYLDEELRCTFPLRTRKQTLTFFSRLNPPPNPSTDLASSDASSPPSPETTTTTTKKSFAVATGELFLGLASRLIRKPSKGPNGEAASVAMFENYGGDGEKNYKERIGAVMEDDIEPEVVWEQRVKDVEAERARRVVTSPGFSFSAAGLLFPYHLGVARLLIENGYIKETTPLAGSSAGAIVCAVIASGASMEEALRATKVLAEDCRNRGTAFRLGAVLRDVLVKFLPDDAHIRSNGRVRVAVTQILWRPKGLLVDKFESKEDLINAVFTSSFIPGYLAPRPATMFRNRLCIDGGLTLFMPPTSAAQTVRVCAFPASRLGLQGIGISPDCNPDYRATPRQLFNWALEPAEDDILDQLFEFGYQDAAVWAKENPVSQVVEDDIPLVDNGLAQ